MDTGKLDIKYDYTEGYGDEPYVVLDMQGGDIRPLKIWEGLFADLLDRPVTSGKGWKGFTRDFHEYRGIWNEDCEPVVINVREYLRDLERYAKHSFSYQETADMFDSLRKYLGYALECGCEVNAQYVD